MAKDIKMKTISTVMQSRLQGVRGLLRKYKANAWVLTHHLDQFYLSGFSFYPGEAVFVIHPKGVACITRELYVGPFGKFAPSIEVIGCDTDRLGVAIDYAKKKKLSRIGFDAAKEMYLAGKRMKQAGFMELPSLIS